MSQQVPQSPDLGTFLLAHDDGPVAASPEFLAPAAQPPGLSRQVGVDEAHESGEPECIRHGQKEMEVVGQKDETADLDGIAPLGSRQDADDDLAELGARRHEKPAMDRPAGYLDESPFFGDEA
jgi:hypothetical protein